MQQSLVYIYQSCTYVSHAQQSIVYSCQSCTAVRHVHMSVMYSRQSCTTVSRLQMYNNEICATVHLVQLEPYTSASHAEQYIICTTISQVQLLVIYSNQSYTSNSPVLQSLLYNTHTHTHTSAHSHTYARTRARTRTHTHTHTHKHTHARTHARTHAHARTRAHTPIKFKLDIVLWKHIYIQLIIKMHPELVSAHVSVAR